MSVIGFILLFIFLWFIYNLVVKVVLPIYKTTNQIKKQFRSMSEQRSAQNNASPATPPSPNKGSGQKREGEYIEFEEVK